MKQIIERFRIFRPGQEVSRKDILDIVSPIRLHSDNEEEIIYVRDEQSIIYADAFRCGTNSLLFDIMHGKFDGKNIVRMIDPGQRYEFKRAGLEWMLPIAKRILVSLHTMNPKAKRYPKYYISEVEWLIHQLEKELSFSNQDVEYCYTVAV